MGSLKSKGIQAILSEICSRLPVGRSGQGLQGPVGKEFGFLRNQPPSPPPPPSLHFEPGAARRGLCLRRFSCSEPRCLSLWASVPLLVRNVLIPLGELLWLPWHGAGSGVRGLRPWMSWRHFQGYENS